MTIDEFLNYRIELLDQSKDDEGFIQESLFLSQILPSMLDSKIVDSEDYNQSFYSYSPDNIKVNGYLVNETGERLQLFIIDERSIDLLTKDDELLVSKKAYFDEQFKRCTKFLNKAWKRQLNDEIQDSSPVRALVSQISSSEGADQFDVVEIFLISAVATVSFMGEKPQPKRIEYEDETVSISYTKDRLRKSKEQIVKKKIIDLNFLYRVLISQGSREVLKVDFEKLFGFKIETIKAADEELFESYLCVLPAKILAGLYKDYSTRLLEKNVRSFLQFRGVNQGIRETIRKEPQKFIAFNNGLTITCTEGDIINESGKTFIKSLTDFQIVNGGQTTAAIYFTQKDGFDISSVNVMAKINIVKESTDEKLEELITKISTFSNTQTKVSKVDLRARNPQLVKLKSLSESVLTPTGLKWFFDRAKGDYSTKLRIAGKNKARIMKEYPNERKFSKEQLGKYFTAWGNQPYMVKKGGEKVFRYFIEEICGEGSSKKSTVINRSFYEELISKIILFKKLEKIYGERKNAMGQIRSAVVPYSISVLYEYTDGAKQSNQFDFLKIWLNEGLENDLSEFFRQLLLLMNDLVKKYSESDDYGEYSKKVELWDAIIKSNEIEDFMSSADAIEILKKYTITREDYKTRQVEKGKAIIVDFHNAYDNVLIHTNGDKYYRKISELISEDLSEAESLRLTSIISAICNRNDIDENLVLFENKLINNIRINKPELFDQLLNDSEYLLSDTLNLIVRKYNSAVESKSDIEFEFEKIGKLAEEKGVSYASVFNTIGKQLKIGTPPKVKQIHYASNYLKQNSEEASAEIIKQNVDVILSELFLRKMVEWDAVSKILTDKQREYIVDFAYGLKKLNSFHEKNILAHLEKLRAAGFQD